MKQNNSQTYSFKKNKFNNKIKKIIMKIMKMKQNNSQTCLFKKNKFNNKIKKTILKIQNNKHNKFLTYYKKKKNQIPKHKMINKQNNNNNLKNQNKISQSFIQFVKDVKLQLLQKKK